MFSFNPRRSLFCRIMSLALVFAFGFYNVSFAVETPVKAPEVREPLTVDDIGIAIDAATVKSRYQGDSGKVIVHIQDAHCNFEAQSNINKVLGQLTSECGIDMISVEGAEGLVDTAWFRAFPDAEIREEVATYFMKKGEITGAEFFSITSDFTGSIFGAETREYYVKNLRAFTDVYPYKASIEKYFTDLGSVATRLKDLVYSSQLRQLDSRMNAFKEKDLDLSEYAEYLSGLAARKNVDVEKYPDFNKLLETLKYEDKIDFDIVDSERSEYIDLLSKKLSKENMTELVAQSIRFKKGHVKAVDFYAYLRELAREHDIKIVREYPNLFYYYLYTKLYDGINNEQLFRELGRVETALKEKLFTSPTERTLDKYAHMVDMYVDLVNIELTNEDYDLFNRYSGEFSMDDVLTFMSGLVSRYNLNYDLGPMPDRIAGNLPRMVNFYEIAIKRDNALIENTLDQMDKQGTDRCVLIAGGFHTRGIKDLLEKKGVSYMVVTPKITKDVETPYIKVLTNQRTSLEDIITESAAVPSVGITASREEIVRPKGDMLNAPERVFWTIPLYLQNPDNPEELKALSDAMGVADGRSLLEATEDTYEEMVSALVRGWIVKVRDRATPEVWEKAVQDWPLLMGAYLAKYAESAAEAGIPVKEGFSAPEEGRRLTDEEIEQVDAQFRKIFQDIVVEETSPGRQAITAGDMTVQQDDIGTPLSDSQHKALNEYIIRPLIEAGEYEIETMNGADVYKLRGLEERIVAYNALAGAQDRLPVNIVHPGRGKDHDGANIYLSARLFEEGPNALNDAEKRALIAHELAHIRSPRKAEKTIIEELNQQEEIDSIRGKALALARQVQERADSVDRMRKVLAEDTVYGSAAPLYISGKEGMIAELADEGDITAAMRESAGLDEWVRKVYMRRKNIDSMQTVLTAPEYKGYDVIIISSSTPDEAASQQEILDRLFAGRETSNDALGNKVCVLSVVDESEGGQIIGQGNTWRRAVDKFRSWADENELEQTDLDEIFRQDKVKIAVYHNGGKGERASPATQALKNSRAAQELVGDVITAEGRRMDLQLLSAILLGTAPLAQSNDGSRVDTFWANQISFGTLDFAKLRRTGHQFDKFVIKVPEDPDRKDLFDYGTTIISETGQPVTFLANKSLARKDSDGKWVINEDFREEYEALMGAPKGAFDFGSFSMSRDMHYALLDYWTNVKGIFRKIDGSDDGRAGISRDIDPALVQVVVPLVNGLGGRELPELPSAEELRTMPEGEAKDAVLEQAYADLKSVMEDEAFIAALDKIYTDPKKKDFVLESVEFFILYNNELFSDMDRVVGNIDMGEDSHWFAYKRILDLSNEKFLMLSDLTGEKQELGAGGEVIRESLDENALDLVRAEDARRMRGIRQDEVARFMLNGKLVILTAGQMREGWEDREANVTVKGSVIQGNTVLLPGSQVINSVVNDSQGLLNVVNSYMEGTVAQAVNAQNSIVFMATDQSFIDANGEIIADAYRPDISDDRFPEGQTRIRASTGYDPKGEEQNDKVVFGDNRYSPQAIREMDVAHKRSDAIMARNREIVRASVRDLADQHRMMALSDPLGLTVAQYAAVIDISEEEARNELNALVEDGMVMPTRRVIFDPDTSDYVEKAPLVYKMVPEIDRGRAMETIKKLRFGTSGLRDDVRNMTDMEVYINTAGYILFLHEQGLLDRDALNVFSVIMDRRPSSPRMAKAVAKAVEDITSRLGYRAELDLGGRAPSPAGAYRGRLRKSFAIVVTGSHIPFNMNGIKFYLKDGEEVLKAHEPAILSAVSKVREEEYAKSWQASIFDDAGMLKDAVDYDLYANEREVNEQYMNRYLEAYPEDLFIGADGRSESIVHWQHSAVGRDVMAKVLEDLGANVIVEERTDHFVPVDTEKITPEMDAKLKAMAERHADERPLSVVFTDGDSDRPGVADEQGNFLTGDKLGLLVAKDLSENIPEDTRLVIAVPVSTNYGVVDELEAMPNVEVIKTGIGSPHVVKAMNDAAYLAGQKGEKVFTMGWEANGGFMLGSAVNLGRQDMARIASRDALPPVLSAHRLRKKLDMPMSEVFRTQIPPVDNYAAAFDALVQPVSEGGFGLDRETADLVKGRMVSMLSPDLADERVVRMDFTEMTMERRRTAEIDGEQVLLFQRETVSVPADYPDLSEWTRVKELLEEVFSSDRGFGSIRAIDILDGIQVVFDNGEVSHLRPSGNDPAFRNYAMAHRDRGVNRPKEIGRTGSETIIPELAEKALKEMRDTSGDEAEQVETPTPRRELWSRDVREGEKVPGTDVPRSVLGVTYADFGGVEGVFDQASIIDRMGRPAILEGREHVITVTEGAVLIEREDRPETTELPEGAKMRIPADYGEYIIRKAGNGNAAVKFDYDMTPGEKAVYSAYNLMNRHWQAIHSGKIDLVVPSEMFVPGGRDTPGSARWEEEQLKKYFQSEDIRLVPYSAAMGLEEAATRTVRQGAEAVLVATRSNIAQADRSSQRVRDFLRGDPEEGIPGVRVLAIPDIDKEEELSGRGWYFTREVEATALLLSTVTREMIETKGTGNAADDLQQLMNQLTGTEIPREYMYYLLSYGEMGEEARAKLPSALREDPFGWMLFLVQNMLLKMPIRPYDPHEQLNQRRQMLWSA